MQSSLSTTIVHFLFLLLSSIDDCSESFGGDSEVEDSSSVEVSSSSLEIAASRDFFFFWTLERVDEVGCDWDISCVGGDNVGGWTGVTALAWLVLSLLLAWGSYALAQLPAVCLGLFFSFWSGKAS